MCPVSPPGRICAVLFVIAALAILLTGCSTIQQQIDKNPDASKLAVQVATMKVIEANGDAHDRAVTTRSIVAAAKVWLDTDNVTVEALHDKVMERVATLHLQPSDAVLVNLLADMAVAEMQKKIGDGLIPADKKVTVNQILSWVDDAAKYY